MFVSNIEGIVKLVEVLPGTSIQNLECAAPCTCQRRQADQCHRPMTPVGLPGQTIAFPRIQSCSRVLAASIAIRLDHKARLHSLQCSRIPKSRN